MSAATPPRPLRWMWPTVCILFVAWALLSRVWVTEDAYITFRSVENLFAGYGLVYNPGERTESFTHPLWMLCLLLIKSAGAPLHSGAIVLGLLFSGSALAILAQGAVRAGRFPFAALALASVSGFRDFATAGMEYSLVFLLLALLLQELEENGLLRNPLKIAALLGLLYLSRPELALLAVYYSALLALSLARITPWRQWPEAVATMSKWSIGLLAIVAPYHLFRALYYHDLFPNTYYAKSGLSAYYEQGLRYLVSVLLGAPVLWFVAALLVAFLLLHRFRSTLAPAAQLGQLRDLGAAFLTGLYIVRVGGDFMAYRFLLPQIFIVVVVAERVLGAWLSHRRSNALFARLAQHGRLLKWIGNAESRRWAALLVFIALCFWPQPLTRGAIADERRYFFEESGASPVSLFLGQQHRWGQAGEDYAALARCLDIDEFWITNSQAQAPCLRGVGLGFFGVAAGPEVRILDEQALPNRDVALKPVLIRWRPGHEHYLDRSHVIDRGMAFCASGEADYDRVMRTDFGIVLSFDPALLSRLPDIEARLQLLAELKSKGSVIIPRLEKRYGQDLAALQAAAADWSKDELLRQYHRCWQAPTREFDRFFY